VLLAEVLEQLGASPGAVAEQDGRAHGRRPGAVVAAEERRQRVAHLAGAERLLGEERELPAVECLGEAAILVGEREPLAQVGGQARADGVEPRRVAPRLRGRDRKQRRDAQRAKVEPLEDDRAGGDRARGREPERADRIGQLAGGVGRLRVGGVDVPRELEDEQAVDVAPELGRHQPQGLGPERRHLAGHDRAQPDVPAELDRAAGREADDGSDGGVAPCHAEERALDLRVRDVERLVVPVEAAAALGDGGQHRQQDGAEEGVVLA
jgi:hypothetical protein